MAVSDETLRELGVLTVGRNPVMTLANLLTGLTDKPDGAVAGADVTDSVTCLAAIQMNADPLRQTVYVQITSAIIAETYTVTVDGANADFVATTADEDDIIAGLIPVINALGKPVFADSLVAGNVTLLRIRETDLGAIVISSSATGAGATADLVEPDTLIFNLWTYEPETGIWYRPDNSQFSVTENWVERLNVAGLTRVYAEVESMSPGGAIGFFYAGPADLE